MTNVCSHKTLCRILNPMAATLCDARSNWNTMKWFSMTIASCIYRLFSTTSYPLLLNLLYWSSLLSFLLFTGLDDLLPKRFISRDVPSPAREPSGARFGLQNGALLNRSASVDRVASPVPMHASPRAPQFSPRARTLSENAPAQDFPPATTPTATACTRNFDWLSKHAWSPRQYGQFPNRLSLLACGVT